MALPNIDTLVGNLTEEESLELIKRVIQAVGPDVNELKDIIEACYGEDDLAELGESWFNIDKD